MSFAARHDARDAEAATGVLQRLEAARARLERRFAVAPGDVGVVIHPRPLALALAHPWLPLARMAAAPASRRYFAGWFTSAEIHVLSPAALADRASAAPGSRAALALTPLHEYVHLVIGANNADLPPPFGLRSFGRYLRWAWLCEGSATHFSGQTRHLGAAIARRLREGPPPRFPPAAADALLLGGTVFDLLERGAGGPACVDLATTLDPGGPRRALERAFARPLAEVERDWREFIVRPA